MQKQHLLGRRHVGDIVDILAFVLVRLQRQMQRLGGVAEYRAVGDIGRR